MLERHLAPGGYLFISHSESLNGMTHGLTLDRAGGLPARSRVIEAVDVPRRPRRGPAARRHRRRHRRVRRVATTATSMIVTHALGSCIAVCIWDPDGEGRRAAALPAARLAHQPERAPAAAGGVRRHRHPAAVPDRVRVRPGQEARASVRLVGGADIDAASAGGAARSVGKRNLLAARSLLWRNGVLVRARGGRRHRRRGPWRCDVGDGRLQISHGRRTDVRCSEGAM